MHHVAGTGRDVLVLLFAVLAATAAPAALHFYNKLPLEATLDT